MSVRVREAFNYCVQAVDIFYKLDFSIHMHCLVVPDSRYLPVSIVFAWVPVG